jgi:hypothetical protein
MEVCTKHSSARQEWKRNTETLEKGGELPHGDIAPVRGGKSCRGVESGCQPDRLMLVGMEREGRRDVVCPIGCGGGKTTFVAEKASSEEIPVLVQTVNLPERVTRGM